MIEPALRRLKRSHPSRKQTTMTIELPTPIAGFFHAHNSGATADLLDHFTAEAVVSDESHEYRGEEIRTWLEGAITNYKPLHAEVTALQPNGNQTVAVARVSGNFPGSPVQLRYTFNLQDNKVAALGVGP